MLRTKEDQENTLAATDCFIFQYHRPLRNPKLLHQETKWSCDELPDTIFCPLSTAIASANGGTLLLAWKWVPRWSKSNVPEGKKCAPMYAENGVAMIA